MIDEDCITMKLDGQTNLQCINLYEQDKRLSISSLEKVLPD